MRVLTLTVGPNGFVSEGFLPVCSELWKGGSSCEIQDSDQPVKAVCCSHGVTGTADLPSPSLFCHGSFRKGCLM